ncbi:MAG: Maf family protein [Planctomycetota bacterium]|jgi:septum formation protein
MLILASASKARRRLLREAGLRFRVVPSRARETMRGTLTEVVRENARRKAASVAKKHPDAWVLAADTMIEFEGRVYGKPRDTRAAVALLSRLAGRTHTLATGVVLRKGKRIVRRVVRSRVRFRDLSRAEIEKLVRGKRPSRFAGGYAVRKGRDPVVARVRGSFTNVVGLPMETVLPILGKVAPECFRRRTTWACPGPSGAGRSLRRRPRPRTPR